MNRKGSALMVIFMVIAILALLGGAMLTRAVSECTLSKNYLKATQAFWLAEAGVNRAIFELGSNFNASGPAVWTGDLNTGSYSVDVDNDVDDDGQVDPDTRRVTSNGYAPENSAAPRTLEADISSIDPANFFDNAIYSAGEVDLNGNAYSVTGKVRYADEIEYSHDNINGEEIQDETISPLANLDFQELYDTSLSQGNVYDATRLNNVRRGRDSFPASFWYSQGTPNIVYVQGDLSLNGNIGTIGGFFVVVGDVLTNPDATQEADINGRGTIEGTIYTRGEFDINGGGGNLNVNGGVWAGEEARLNGNATVTYNQTYMDAIEALDIIVSDVEIDSWKDTQNPYLVQ